MSAFRKVMTRVVAVTASAVAVTSALPAPASADVIAVFRTGDGTLTTCSDATLCVYEHTSFQGEMFGIRGNGDIPKFYAPSQNENLNDKASSVVSNSSLSYCFFDGTNYTGAKFLVGFNKLYPNLNSAGFGDKLSSWKVGAC
ncbi:peptidase inhibitor family I36 protein [[Kitasatospora] papulosa]|uniref:peptidase inhibitor family I36 protein n=1 Tax=[Kitasatospora] papulosa TaxID=1464011 RepID=UPI0036C738A9